MSGSASTAGRVSLLICLLFVPVASGNVIYVDDDAAGANDGTSWTNAFRYLQDALAVASGTGSKTPPRWPPGATHTEIHVARGVYTPDRDSAHPEGTRDRSACFRLLSDVALMGGFAGVGTPDPDARDIAHYETILSGDLADDDVVVPDPCDLLTEPTRGENSYAVVTAGACSRTTVLDGFTIRAGNAFGPERAYTEARGAGLLLSYYGADCCPSVKNCTFVGNCAYYGGATFVIGARPELIDCTFVGNAGIEGGALCTSMWRNTGWVVSACAFVVRGCHFTGNYARDHGGAVYVGPGEPFVIEGGTFTRNSAWEGGALYNSQSVGLTSCLLIHNVAVREGGAVSSKGGTLDILSCTFSGNTAPAGWALSSFTPRMTVTNSIFWDDGDEHGGEIRMGEITGADITHSDIRGGWSPDEGNIDADPLFADPGHWDPNGTPDDPNDDVWVDGDYHLKSQAGRWDSSGKNWVRDEVTSPCIDAGDPASSVGGEPQPNGGRINLGVYGGTLEASKSPAAGPTEGLWSEPVPLTEVNRDDAEEWGPVLSPDGLTLYFTRVGGPESDLGRVFQAARPSAEPYSRFTAVTQLPGALNQSPEHVLAPWFSADGLRLYYTYQQGSVFGLKVSERAAGSPRWPAGTEIREINQLSSRLHSFRLTRDELTIFFAGPDMQGGGRGGADYDIWMATRPHRNAPFAEPAPMTGLNSTGNDVEATPSADGLALYFASNRNGRYELFRSTRAGVGASFGPPVHLTMFDTPGGHSTFPYLSPDGTEFYLIRQVGEDRTTRDIWVSYRLD